jgi:hypothetical protein
VLLCLFCSVSETSSAVQRSSYVPELWCGGSWFTGCADFAAVFVVNLICFLVLFSVLGVVGRRFGLRVVVLVLPSFCFLEVSSLVCQRRR